MEVEVPHERHIHNIDQRFAVRQAHSEILRKIQNLFPDRLQKMWDASLAADGWTGHTAVSIKAIDAWGCQWRSASDGYEQMARADSLVTRYVGMACEAGVTGYLHLPW